MLMTECILKAGAKRVRLDQVAKQHIVFGSHAMNY